MTGTGRRKAIEDGGRLSWRSIGRGPPLVLVNGYAATASDWDPAFLSALASSFEVVCPDNRGVGGAALGAGLVTVESMARDVEALLDALEIERAQVAGWSMGGFIAQRLASVAPERVEALVLLSTDPGGAEAVLADPEVWARLTDRSGSPREQAARMIASLFPPETAAEIDRRFGGLVAAPGPSCRRGPCRPRRPRWPPGTPRSSLARAPMPLPSWPSTAARTW